MPPLGLFILILVIAFPLLEIAILIKVGSMIGIWATLGIIVTTFVLGIMVVRLQGLGVARRLVAAARSGETPVEPMIEGMLLMLAGGCLIAPGLITDGIGLILLIPPVRQWTARWIVARGIPMTVRVRRARSQAPGQDRARPRRPGPAPVIEGDYERIDETPVTRKPSPPGEPPQR
jgi:UPF0716 protein FxsA